MVPQSCDDAACAGGTDGLQPLIGIRHSTAPTSAAPLPRSGIEMQRPAASAKAPHPTPADDPDGPAVTQHCRESTEDAPGGAAGDTGSGARAGARARAGPGMGAGPEDSMRDDSGALEWSDRAAVSSRSRENSSSSLSCAYLMGVPKEAFSVRPSSTTPSTARMACSASSRLA